MSVPVRVSFRDMPASVAVEESIRKKAAKLEQLHDRLIGIDVHIEVPHKAQTKGRRFHVRVNISVPGTQLVVNQSNDDQSHESLSNAINDAFKAARRELRDHLSYVRTQARKAGAAE